MDSGKEGHDSVYHVALLYSPEQQKPIAQIKLNGYIIRPGGPLRYQGLMRSFKLLRGSLLRLSQEWDRQALLTMKVANLEMTVRVAAMPASDEDDGFIEFVQGQPANAS